MVRSIGWSDFVVGIGMLFVIEGLMFAAIPAWMREATKRVEVTPDTMLRIIGIVSAVVGLGVIWLVRR